MRKHPRVISGGKTINMADLEADWLVMLQHRHYNLFFLGFAIILPTLLPSILWGEALSTAYFVTGRRIQLNSDFHVGNKIDKVLVTIHLTLNKSDMFDIL